MNQTTNNLAFSSIDQDMAHRLGRQGGGSWMGQDGRQWTTGGPNQIELLHDIRDLLVEIRDALKAKP